MIGQCPTGPADAVLKRARETWELDIFDPDRGDVGAGRPLAVRSRDAIDSIIELGLGWESRQLGGTQKGPYRWNGDFAWCGAFAAWCWRAAGLRAYLRDKSLASTKRLWKWAPRGNARRVARTDVRAGDLVIVRTTGDEPIFGDHIVLAAAAPDPVTGWIAKWAGNDKNGIGPKGNRREGVVKGEVSPADFVWALRPLPEDLEPKETR